MNGNLVLVGAGSPRVDGMPEWEVIAASTLSYCGVATSIRAE